MVLRIMSILTPGVPAIAEIPRLSKFIGRKKPVIPEDKLTISSAIVPANICLKVSEKGFSDRTIT